MLLYSFCGFSRVSDSLPSEVALQEAQPLGQEPSASDMTGCSRADHLNQPTFGSSKGVPNVTRGPADYEAFRRVAVDVFKTQNLNAIRPLKKFLAALPSPSYIRRVLLEAIYQLAQEDPFACRWVIHHHQALEPEVDLVSVAQTVATERLQNRGLRLNQDFSFTSEGQLQTSDAIRNQLMEDISAGDRLLMEEILLR